MIREKAFHREGRQGRQVNQCQDEPRRNHQISDPDNKASTLSSFASFASFAVQLLDLA
jgi:hypothetical protein